MAREREGGRGRRERQREGGQVRKTIEEGAQERYIKEKL